MPRPPFRNTFGRTTTVQAPETRAEHKVVWSTVHMPEPIHVETEIRICYRSRTSSKTVGYSSGKKFGQAFRSNKASE